MTMITKQKDIKMPATKIRKVPIEELLKPNFEDLLKLMVEKCASDLHLRVPSPPVLRIDGRLIPQTDLSAMTPELIEDIFTGITSNEQKEMFYRDHELDFALSYPGLARFRISVLRQRDSLSMALRQVPFTIPTVDGLGLPQILKKLILKPRGLVLITGPTGSGKSTSLASMVNHLNENDSRNIITIEDPIEYLHENKKCLIAQRELRQDTKSFTIALKHALRHDPDVIIVGEMRDLETISTAISAAETGHLVLGTLHTTDTPQTIDRMLDMFPPEQQQQVRLQLSQVIEAVCCQTLLRRACGKGRVAAFEIMTANAAIRNLIRERKSFEITSVIQLNSLEGMQTLDQSLSNLVRNHDVTLEEALTKSSNPEKLKKSIHGRYPGNHITSF